MTSDLYQPALSNAEYPAFFAWVSVQTGFTACPHGLETPHGPRSTCDPLLGGSVRQRGRDLTAEQLIDRWRSLGRPAGKRRQPRQPRQYRRSAW